MRVLVSLFVLAAAAAVSLFLGRASFSLDFSDPVYKDIVLDWRLPRIIAAVLVGGALSAGGAVLQTSFRNPLVSPDLLGVSAGAGLGAVLAMYLGAGHGIVVTAAFLGAILAVLLSSLAAAFAGRASVLSLVLSGVIVSAFAGACLSLTLLLSDPAKALHGMMFWLTGSLSMAGLQQLPWLASLVLLPLVLIMLSRFRLRMLLLGDSGIALSGVDPRKSRLWFILLASLMTAAAVSVSGIIGWVGLCAPHLARMLSKDPRDLVPLSFTSGGIILLVCDDAARCLFPGEIPVGLMTAVIGAPAFILIMRRYGRQSDS